MDSGLVNAAAKKRILQEEKEQLRQRYRLTAFADSGSLSITSHVKMKAA